MIMAFVSGILVLVQFQGRKMIWSMIGFFGIAVMALAVLVLVNDADLTMLNNGINVAIASANGNFISDFNLISMGFVSALFGEVFVTLLHMFKFK
jgi:hypothetical protein